MTPTLTPLALQNHQILRAIAGGGIVGASALAAAVGRDVSNVRKSVKALVEAELLTTPSGPTTPYALAPQGASALAALERAEGGAPPDAALSPVPTAAGIMIRHDLIIPDPLNPRKFFDPEAAAELAESIARDDLLENLVVRPAKAEDDALFETHRLVAGERRWRAIQLLIRDGRWPADKPIACKVVDIDDAAHRRIALVENLQRQDLRPIDEAEALKALIEITGAGTLEIAKEIGSTQRFVQQRLQLLDLDSGLQAKVNDRTLPIEKARELLAMWPKLPEIKRAEIRAGKTSVEDAKRWLSEQPEPLSPRALLALAEFIDAAKVSPAPGNYYTTVEVQATTSREEKESHTQVRVTIDDPVVGELCKAMILSKPERIFDEGVETGRHKLSMIYWGEQNAKLRCPEVVDAKKRPALIKRLRAEILGEEAAASWDPEIFVTPWLNGPFVTLPGIEAEIAEKKAASEERTRTWQARRDAEDAKAKADRAALQGRVQAAAAAEAELRLAGSINAGALAGSIIASALGLSLRLPLYMGPKGQILDAAGTEVVDTTWEETQLPGRRLLVAIVNAAAGLETPAKPPIEIDPHAPSRDEFLQAAAGYLFEDSEDLSDTEEGRAKALARATRGLDVYLANEGIDYGAAAYDWEDSGAMSLAEGIRVDGLGMNTEDEELPASVQALATGHAKPIAGGEEKA